MFENRREKYKKQMEYITTRPAHIIYKFPMQTRVLSDDYGVYDYHFGKDLNGKVTINWFLRFYTHPL